MKVKLSDIKSATPRVRKELNLDKLDELAASIKETGGVIVPVKLRKNGEKYTTVYGHRRIEATRMAGLDEIEAFIADVDDAELLTQALIENVVREDMQPIDVAKAFKQIMLENEWSKEQVGARFGMGGDSVFNYLLLLKPKTQEVVESYPDRITHQHVMQARAGTDDPDDMVKVLEKSAKEQLSKRQTRTVAEEYTRIKTDYGTKAAKKVLDTPFSKSGLPTFTPTPKPTPPTETKIESEILFQWVRDERVLLAEEGLRAISACVSAINTSKEDRGGGKMVLKNLLGRTQIVLDQLNEVLDGYDK
jgi:ParB family chromosome partitioning protein